MRREAAPESCVLQGHATPLPQTLPGAGIWGEATGGNGGAETLPETLKLLTTSWGQKHPGRERVFINLAPVTEPSAT